MNFFTAFSQEKNPPVLKKLYGGRWRMTRTLLLSDGTEMAEDTFPPRGTRFAYECSDNEKALVLDAGINPDDFHLIDMGTGGGREEIEIISVWETLTDTLVDADKPKIDYDLNGLKRVTHTLIGLPDIDMSTYDFVVGDSEHATGGPVLAQFKDETDDSATKITAVYIMPGVTSTSSRLSNNGALEVRSINSWKMVPATPIGFVLVGTTEQNSSGFPSLEYNFAKGVGVISTTSETKFGGVLTLSTRVELTSASGTADAIAGEYERDYKEDSGYRVWTLRGAVGSGIISDNTQTKLGGVLSVRTVTSVGTPYNVANEYDFSVEPHDGYTIYTSRGASGSGQSGTQTDVLLSGYVNRVTISSVNTVPTTPVGGVLSSSEITQADGYILYRYTYTVVTSADLPDETTLRHNNKLTLTTKRKINTAPTGAGVLIGSRSNPGNGYTIYESVYATGAGEIDTQTDTLLTGHVNRVTVTCIGSAGTVPVGGVVSSSDTSEADGYTLYRTSYTVVTSADLPDETTLRHNNKLTLTTKRKINTAPTGTGVLISSRSNPGNGYTIYESVYATGAGVIDTEVGLSLNGKLTTTTIRQIGAVPTSPGGPYVERIRLSTQEADGYTLYVATFVSGEGEVSSASDSRADGSTVISKTLLNNPTATAPASSHQIGQKVSAHDGYVLYVLDYYTKPTDYSTVGIQQVTVPGVMAFSSSGPSPSREPVVRFVDTSINVTFTTTPSAGSNTAISAFCTSYESASLTDGTSFSKNTSHQGYYAGGAYATTGSSTYRGMDCSSVACGTGGSPDQVGTLITFSFHVTPYFTSGGTTIYKQTKETGTL